MAKETSDQGTVQSREGTALAQRPSEKFRDWLLRLAIDEEEADRRAWEVAASQLDRLLEASSYDDIMDADSLGARQCKDLIGFEFSVDAGFGFPPRPPGRPGFEVIKSADKFKATLDVYIQFYGTALIDYPAQQIKIGDLVLMSTGAPLIIGKFRSLEANNHLPQSFKIEGTDATNGTVLKLARAPSRAIRA